MTTLPEALEGLRDLDDVIGSFLLTEDGRLVARDLPAVFHADLFADVGPRLARMRQMFSSTADASEPATLTLRFSEHSLHVRSLGQLLLCVVTEAKVNAPALRMAINLVARRVANASATRESEVPPPTMRSQPAGSMAPVSSVPSSTAPASSVPSSAPVSGRHEVLYRGRRTR